MLTRRQPRLPVRYVMRCCLVVNLAEDTSGEAGLRGACLQGNNLRPNLSKHKVQFKQTIFFSFFQEETQCKHKEY